MLADLQDALDRKEDKTESQRKYDDLLDRIKNLKPSGPSGPAITDDDISRWNANCDKTQALQDLLDKLKKELHSINAE